MYKLELGRINLLVSWLFFFPFTWTAFTRFKIKEYSETKNHFVSKDVEKIHKDEDRDLSPPRKHAKLGDSDVITIGTVSSRDVAKE